MKFRSPKNSFTGRASEKYACLVKSEKIGGKLGQIMPKVDEFDPIFEPFLAG